MRRKFLISMAGFFYTCAVLFALFVTSIVIRGNSYFNLLSLVTCFAGVFIPAAIGSALLLACVKAAKRRYLVMMVFLTFLLLFYSVLLLSLLFRGSHRHYMSLGGMDLAASMNLVPFKTIGEYVQAFSDRTMNHTIVYQNLFGNLFLFTPFGLLLPCIFKGMRSFMQFTFVMIILLVAVEAAQMMTRTGSCDIDDVILNLAGAMMFYGIWKLKKVQQLLAKAYLMRA